MTPSPYMSRERLLAAIRELRAQLTGAKKW